MLAPSYVEIGLWCERRYQIELQTFGGCACPAQPPSHTYYFMLLLQMFTL